MFGRCRDCGRIRWVTSAYMQRYGVVCHRCGSQVIRPARPGLFERFYLLYWYLWEHVQMSHSRWWLNPVEWCRGIYNGLRVG